MILLDTDTLTLYLAGHPRVTARFQATDEAPAISIVSRIEVLQGRFASVLTAANADQLLLAQDRLDSADRGLAPFKIVSFNAAAAEEFDKLRQNKKLKKIGRADLLIASIALASRATLVTRNLKHFHQIPGLQVENWAD
jgi:tRNA(fMet)-specific endonuclease VapC